VILIFAFLCLEDVLIVIDLPEEIESDGQMFT
jgi:hypothetical protein